MKSINIETKSLETQQLKMQILSKKLLSKLADPQEWTPEWGQREILELQAIWADLQELLEYFATQWSESMEK